MLGIIIALLILLTGWLGALKAMKSASGEVLMFYNELKCQVQTRHSFARHANIRQQTATTDNTSYLAKEDVPVTGYYFDTVTK